MQRSIDKYVNTLDMDFNVNNCGVTHIGRRNLDFQYQMNDEWVKSVDEERI